MRRRLGGVWIVTLALAVSTMRGLTFQPFCQRASMSWLDLSCFSVNRILNFRCCLCCGRSITPSG